ncbi:hypothetical protein ACFXKD_20490 [Nocardiopsis aegyptia]|uniref:hypothetical protein n=1 Tax=Nocardiopsis aegyptia TaxID=220378 RepID=UPI00366CB34C
MTTTKTLAAASGAALLTLTACSGGSVVYDFTEPVMDPVQSVEFHVPAELVELSEDYGETRVFDSITVGSVEAEDPSRCAVEYRFEYADGGLDRVLAYIEATTNAGGSSEAERMARILTDREPDSIELSEDYTSAVVPLQCAVSPTDDENTASVNLTRIVDEDTDTFASAEIAAMQGGDLFVHEPEIDDDWQLDSNGNWIQ